MPNVVTKGVTVGEKQRWSTVGSGRRLKQAKLIGFVDAKRTKRAEVQTEALDVCSRPEKKREEDVAVNASLRTAEEKEAEAAAMVSVQTEKQEEEDGRSEKAGETSASAWKTLLSGPRPPPLCHKHREVSVMREVKKDGPNKGRRFYVCSRPEGAADHPKYVTTAKTPTQVQARQSSEREEEHLTRFIVLGDRGGGGTSTAKPTETCSTVLDVLCVCLRLSLL